MYSTIYGIYLPYSMYLLVHGRSLNRNFVEEKLSSKYVESTRPDLAKSYEDTSPATPIFFILSPGVNPLKDVESLGKFNYFHILKGYSHLIK